MKNISNKSNEVFPNPKNNLLWEYVQTLAPETVAKLSQPSSEAMGIMEKNIIDTLGGLPHESFQVNITTSRESLGKLLASAMVSGYFLRTAEERLSLEQMFADNLEEVE